jgi:hypothetical protein
MTTQIFCDDYNCSCRKGIPMPGWFRRMGMRWLRQTDGDAVTTRGQMGMRRLHKTFAAATEGRIGLVLSRVEALQRLKVLRQKTTI